ncbi:MAG: RNA 2',3'-cyclic phosphodiesterase [Desulfobacterales bacterium]
MNQNRIRAFIAFHLPEDVQNHIRERQDHLRSCQLHLRWVAPENIHLTLKFLGDINPDDTERIAQAMSQAVQNTSLLHLGAKGIGVFPNMRRARVLWTGLTGDTHNLIALQNRLDDRLADLGYEKESRPFKAHLTLARAKESPDPKNLLAAMEKFASFASPDFTAGELILWQSHLHRSGAVYTKLKSVFLTSGS